jgi:hypothetical protein
VGGGIRRNRRVLRLPGQLRRPRRAGEGRHRGRRATGGCAAAGIPWRRVRVLRPGRDHHPA